MRLVFLGPPGAGKGTQAAGCAKRFSIPHISTGDILRRAIELATPTGLAAKEYVDRGELVPFEIILRLVRDRLREKDAQNGWVLDGFPRSLEQAEAFGELLSELGTKLDRVVYFRVSDEEVVRRLSGRRICRTCQAPYHVSFSPPREGGKCDREGCGGELYQRSDDHEESILKRLAVYAAETNPLVAYYESAGVLLAIDGEQPINRVEADIETGLSRA